MNEHLPGPPEPPDFDITSTLWVLWMSWWGSAVAYLQSIKKHPTEFSILVFMIELLTSGFVGVLTAFLAIKGGLDWWEMSFAVGMSGHFGTRMVFLFRQRVSRMLGLEP